jgi:hypothetical protein
VRREYLAGGERVRARRGGHGAAGQPASALSLGVYPISTARPSAPAAIVRAVPLNDLDVYELLDELGPGEMQMIAMMHSQRLAFEVLVYRRSLGSATT